MRYSPRLRRAARGKCTKHGRVGLHRRSVGGRRGSACVVVGGYSCRAEGGGVHRHFGLLPWPRIGRRCSTAVTAHSETCLRVNVGHERCRVVGHSDAILVQCGCCSIIGQHNVVPGPQRLCNRRCQLKGRSSAVLIEHPHDKCGAGAESSPIVLGEIPP